MEINGIQVLDVAGLNLLVGKMKTAHWYVAKPMKCQRAASAEQSH